MAGCKQGLLFQKSKLPSWGTRCIHILHHPLGRKQFRKEIGVCITQRNNIKSHYPAFELMRNLTLITSKHTEIQLVPFIKQKRSSYLLNIQKTHQRTGKIFCSVKLSNKKCTGQALLHHAQDWAWYISPCCCCCCVSTNSQQRMGKPKLLEPLTAPTQIL